MKINMDWMKKKKPTLQELQADVERLEKERKERLDYEIMQAKKDLLISEQRVAEFKKSMIYKIFGKLAERFIKKKQEKTKAFKF